MSSNFFFSVISNNDLNDISKPDFYLKYDLKFLPLIFFINFLNFKTPKHHTSCRITTIAFKKMVNET